MRFSRLLLFAFVLLPFFPAWPQRVQPAMTPAPQEPQAVSVLNQALTVAGGTAPLKAITDYTASRNITYHWNPEEQGAVTIQGLGLGEIRIDSNLPSWET